ncbi:MAG: glycosyltransferase family 4 protein [Chloroflexota bacterium]
MLIGIDSSRATRSQRTGTENYSLRLIRALLAMTTEHRFRLYCNENPTTDLFPNVSRAEIRTIPMRRLWTQLRLSAEVALRCPDVLFIPAHVVPLICRPPAVVTVHDLGYSVFPGAHSTQSRLYLDLSTRYGARWARRVIVPSAFTKRDLTLRLGIDADKIHVVPEACGEEFRPPTNMAAARAVAASYGLQRPYVAAVGTIHPRKNLERLLAAYGRVRQRERLPHQLALIGQAGWQASIIAAAVRRHGLEDVVVSTGYVSEPDLPSVLGAAELLAFPSLYEGFGLPALEAMACGVPVLAANSTSLPEVTGDAAHLVDPLDEDAIADGLTRLLADNGLRADLRERGLIQARQFSWERAASETLAVLQGAASA